MTSVARDVIVVGGGIVGCLTAYLLARQGLKVTLLEAEAVGSHASGFAFGELGALEGAGIPNPLLEFTLWCFRRHPSLAQELQEQSGVDYRFKFCHRLMLAFDQTAVHDFKEHLAWQRQVKDCTVQWLEPAEVVRVEPRANPHCLGAVYVHRSAALEPYQYTLAAIQSAERAGVQTVLRRVTGLLRRGDRCLGVTYQGGQLEAETVVLAMGPWTSEASAWCGSNIPVTPLKGQILRLRLEGPALAHSLHYGGSYMALKPDGLLWAGTTEERVGFNEEPTRAGRDKIMRDVLTMAPSLAEAQLVQHTACLRPLSSDGLPIVGLAPGWRNLYLGTGAGRKGILWSTGMSQGLADLILQGESAVPGLAHLDPARFQGE
ncbi:MAG TPA: FAD-dependent oxidoreductase [Dehalococcoidia bacterium]|nr:FAD-dependent oxidoreductase [Dehalococcoidia bacterium]